MMSAIVFAALCRPHRPSRFTCPYAFVYKSQKSYCSEFKEKLSSQQSIFLIVKWIQHLGEQLKPVM